MRRIEQILRHPRTADEERIAVEHIRPECERIQAGVVGTRAGQAAGDGDREAAAAGDQMRDVVGAGQ